MGRKKRTQWYLYRVLLLGQLLLTLFFTFWGIRQTVYRFGMDTTLSNGAYQVKKVIKKWGGLAAGSSHRVEDC
jgi:hypothetical protein